VTDLKWRDLSDKTAWLTYCDLIACPRLFKLQLSRWSVSNEGISTLIYCSFFARCGELSGAEYKSHGCRPVMESWNPFTDFGVGLWAFKNHFQAKRPSIQLKTIYSSIINAKTLKPDFHLAGKSLQFSSQRTVHETVHGCLNYEVRPCTQCAG